MDKVTGLAFFDLDGTLLDEHSQISEPIAQALVTLKGNGIIPFIATGRTNTEIQHVLDQTPISSSITMNGQFALFEEQEVINHKIAPSIATRLHQKTQEFGQELAFYSNLGITVSKQTNATKKCYDYIHQDMPAINQDDISLTAYNMLLILGEDLDEHYHDAFPELTFYRNGPYSIDVVNKNISKGKAVQDIKKFLQLPDIPTYGFGDGLNDVALLEACDYKIAMGNGIDAVKEIATYITTKNTDDGIINALHHHKLI